MKGTALLREAAGLAGVSILYSKNLPSDLQRAALFVYITIRKDWISCAAGHGRRGAGGCK